MPPREQPRQSYIPRARVELIVRIEDFGDTANPVPPAPAMPPHLRSGKKKGGTQDDKLRVEKEGDRFVLRSPTADQNQGTPQRQIKSIDGRTFRIDGIVPLRATLNRNGPRMADTLSLSLPFADLPLDPRVIRSIAVNYWMGCITPEQLAEEAQGKRYTPCPDTFVDAYGRTRSNQRFQGFVDGYEVTLNEGAPEVSLECTDNTRILIDQDAPVKLTVSPDKPLDEAVADYLSNFPQFVGLSVEYRPGGVTVPSLGQALAKTAYKPKLGPPPAGGGTGGKMTVWDYLTDIAGSIGLMVRFEGTTVIFQRPRTFYQGRGRARPDDPFRGRVLPTGRQIDSRLLVYGRNVDELGFKRRFTRNVSTNVEVRCYSPRLGKTLVARYPVGKSDRQSKPVPGDKQDTNWKVITVYGIEDEPTLRVVAQGVYEQLGRSELTGKVVTQNLGSFGGSNRDPDLLDVQAGDSVVIEVQRNEPTLTAMGGQGGGKAQTFLEQLGYPSEFAAAYQAAITNIGLPTKFRVRTAAVDWDFEQGVTVDLEVVNYVEVRASKELPEGEEVPNVDPATEPDQVQVETG